MREGVPGRGLWFAGEHTSPFVALGTVTGAYWSGEGVAGRIAMAYGMVDDADGGDPRGEVDGGVVKNGKVGGEHDVNVRGFADLALEK